MFKCGRGELEALQQELKDARRDNCLRACQGSIFRRYSHILVEARVKFKLEFAQLIGQKNTTELNKELALYRYDLRRKV